MVTSNLLWINNEIFNEHAGGIGIFQSRRHSSICYKESEQAVKRYLFRGLAPVDRHAFSSIVKCEGNKISNFPSPRDKTMIGIFFSFPIFFYRLCGHVKVCFSRKLFVMLLIILMISCSLGFQGFQTRYGTWTMNAFLFIVYGLRHTMCDCLGKLGRVFYFDLMMIQ